MVNYLNIVKIIIRKKIKLLMKMKQKKEKIILLDFLKQSVLHQIQEYH